MKKILFSIAALGVFSASFAQTFSTGFEKTNDNAGWDPTGAVNSWAQNSFTGNVNTTPGFGFVKNSGYIIAGAQSAEVSSSANNLTDYSATRSINSKKLFVSTLMAPLSYNVATSTAQRGFGLIAASGWRWVLAKNGTNSYILSFSNGVTFSTTTLATLTGTNLDGQTHYMSMDIDLSKVGANQGVAKLRFNNNVYTQTFNTTTTTSAMTSVGMLSRGVAGNTSGTARFDRFGYTVVPEPASLLAIGGAVAAMAARKRRK